MTEQTPKTTEPLKNPYIAILEERRKKRRGKRDPDNMVRYAFALFSAKLWEKRLPVRFGIETEKNDFSKYENYAPLGGPITEEELARDVSLFPQRTKFLLEERVENWLINLEQHTTIKSSEILSKDYDRELLFRCIADTKVKNGNEPETIVYIDADKIEQLKPLLSRWNQLKGTSVVDIRASDLIAKVICDFYGAPDDAFRTLTPKNAKRLRGLQSTPEIDACFFCRFDRKTVKKFRSIMSCGGFYQSTDLYIITKLSSEAIIDPKEIYEKLQRLKANKELDFFKYLDEYSGKNGTYALDNPTLEDFFY